MDEVKKITEKSEIVHTGCIHAEDNYVRLNITVEAKDKKKKSKAKKEPTDDDKQMTEINWIQFSYIAFLASD